MMIMKSTKIICLLGVDPEQYYHYTFFILCELNKQNKEKCHEHGVFRHANHGQSVS